MNMKTPLSVTCAAALSRVLDNVPKGYTRYTRDVIRVEKIAHLVEKFRDRHAIHVSPTQRYLRKKKGQANALLTVHFSTPTAEGAASMASTAAQWLLQFTPGELDSPETLVNVADKPPLQWLEYELVRHAARGKTSWTWRRSKEEMQALFGMLVELCQRQQWREVERFLQRAAHQPGFHGVREQTWRLCEAAKQHGYQGPIPHLFYMQKIKHGGPIALTHWIFHRFCIYFLYVNVIHNLFEVHHG